ncbi:DUF6087 family protein [Streptomyces sp. NPDC059070]|uniref:DUF6087 family protein n=1 Tax=unclassified Streptomyces TaxID=2593676 RepID=UPI0034E26042
MHEEPLEEWARRREERRARSAGKLRAIPLTRGPHQGAHIEPDTPRVIQEWNGSEWVAVGVAEDLAAAKALLYPPRPAEDGSAEWDCPPPGEGGGRHRRPSPADEREQ